MTPTKQLAGFIAKFDPEIAKLARASRAKIARVPSRSRRQAVVHSRQIGARR